MTVRLIDHLRKLGMSNREAKAALSTGKVYVGDAPTADPARDVVPARVSIRPNAPRVRPWVDVVVVYRDEHLAVVAKPPGVLSVPAASKRGARNVLAEGKRVLGAALPVHRLDEDTSGLMLVARNPRCQQALKELLFVHDVQRRYVAIVAGNFPAGPRRHETHLVRDRGDGLRGSGAAPDGKRAVTHFTTLRSLGKARTLVEARLETGRTHQIRIHLAELGFPVLGDKLYAKRGVTRLAPRLALHAAVLGFRHPMTGQTLRFEAPVADDLERLIRSSEP